MILIVFQVFAIEVNREINDLIKVSRVSLFDEFLVLNIAVLIQQLLKLMNVRYYSKASGIIAYSAHSSEQLNFLVVQELSYYRDLIITQLV